MNKCGENVQDNNNNNDDECAGATKKLCVKGSPSKPSIFTEMGCAVGTANTRT